MDPRSEPEVAAGFDRLLAQAFAAETQVTSPAGTPPPALPAPGDRYETREEIARGGMGVVLRGQDKSLGREVAIKVLLGPHAKDPGMVARFLEEAQIGGQLQHPGLVPVHDLGVGPDGRPFFAMKLVEGQTLAALLADRPDPAHDRSRFLGVFHQVCQTMAYAHSRGVLHRDLKPHNVMVGAFGEVLVMDWGLAKVLGGPEGPRVRVGSGSGSGTGAHSAAGSTMGTPAYCAPEQARGEIDAIDERADVFGLGAILCEILTGQPPYVAEGRRAILAQAERGELAPATERLARCGAETDLVDLAIRCLAADREGRPRNASEVAQAIGDHLAAVEERARAAEITAARASAHIEAAKARALVERRARRLATTLAAGIVLALVSGGSGWLWLEGRDRARREKATADVRAALDESTRLHATARAALEFDAGGWAEALSAAQRAVAMAPGADPATAERASAVLASLTADEASARARADQIAKDRRIVVALEKLRLSELTPATLRWRDHGPDAGSDPYAPVFHDYGLDIHPLREDTWVDTIRSSAIRRQLVAGLDDWALTHMATLSDAFNTTARQLFAVANRCDADLFRGRVRHALLRDSTGTELAALAAAPDASTQPFHSVAMLGRGLMHSAQYATAIRLLADFNARYPHSFNLELALAYARLTPPDNVLAQLHAHAAYALAPDIPAVQYAYAFISVHAGKRDQAWLLRQLSPDASVYNNFGLVLFDNGHTLLAQNLFTEANRLAPQHWQPHLNNARCLRDLRHYPEAIRILQDAIANHPGEALLHNELGKCLVETDDYERAQAVLEEAIRLDPGHGDTYSSLATLLYRRGRIQEGIKQAQLAVSLAPWNLQLRWTLGLGLHAIGDLYSARDALAIQRTSIPRLTATHTRKTIIRLKCLADCLSALGEEEQMLELCRQAIRQNPDTPDVHDIFADAARRAGRLSESVAAAHSAIGLGCTNVDRVYLKVAEKALALQHYSAYSPDPAPDATKEDLLATAEAHRAGGRQAQSVHAYSRLLRIHRIRPAWKAPEIWERAARTALLAADRPTTETEVAQYRGHALAFLSTLLEEARSIVKRPKDEWTPRLLRLYYYPLLHVRYHPTYAPVKYTVRLASLPADQQETWLSFWTHFDACLADVQQKFVEGLQR